MAGQKQDFYEEDFSMQSFYDLPEFHAYCERIRKILDASGKRPLSIADIHRKLGKHVIQRYTMDALSMIHTEMVGCLPTRYRLLEHKPIRVYSYKDRKEGIARCFPTRQTLYAETDTIAA